jgi:hypothetical protein
MNFKIGSYAKDDAAGEDASYANVVSAIHPSASQNTVSGLTEICPGLNPGGNGCTTINKKSGESTTVLSWDSTAFCKAKADYVVAKGAGIMLWTLDRDACGDPTYSQLEAVYSEIHGGQ